MLSVFERVSIVMCCKCVVSFLSDLFMTGFVITFPETGDSILAYPALWAVVWFLAPASQYPWVIYGLSTLCREGINKAPLYVGPSFIGSGVYFTFIMSLAAYVGWLFALDRQRLGIALALLVVLFSLLCSCCFLSIRGLRLHGDALYRHGLGRHLRLVRIMLQNGLAIFAAWTALRITLLIPRMLVDWAGMDTDLYPTVAYAITAAMFLVYLILDWFVLETHMRYIFSPYFMAVLVTLGAFFEIFQGWSRNEIFAIVIVGAIGLATFLKLIMAGSRISNLNDPVLAEDTALVSKMLQTAMNPAVQDPYASMQYAPGSYYFPPPYNLHSVDKTPKSVAYQYPGPMQDASILPLMSYGY